MIKWIAFAIIGLSSVVSANMVDVMTFGNAESEQQHQLEAGRSEIITGGLGESARRLLPPETENWEGGRIAFTLKVDPEKQNYVTVRLWGSDTSPNILFLICDGKQIGWRHLGEIEPLDMGDSEPGCNGRFFYRTSPLPLLLTQGKAQLKCEIRSSGPIWGYGQSFDKYQKMMTVPSRGIYRLYTHTDGFFIPPADEKQGQAPANPPLRKEPGIEMLDQVKQRVNRELEGILKDPKPVHQMKMQFLAKAYYVKWTVAYQNPQVTKQVIKGGDELFAAYRKDPKVAQSGPNTYNADWFGLGPVGDCCWMLAEQLKPFMDEKITDGTGTITRRAAWSEMLVASRDWHRQHRRLYTNQSMINDMYIYSAHRGVAAIDPSNAVPDEPMRRYLYESLGLEPWRGSDKGGQAAGSDWSVGDNYWQLTKKGLTKELGFVGYYGEVLDWVVQIYDVTRPLPGQPGDEKIKAQLETMARARAIFRYPAIDAEGNRAMRIETIIGWRDTHYPGDVCYGERISWDGSALYAAAATLDAESIGYAQQMFDDNQFFESLKKTMKDGGLRVTAALLGVPDQYEALKAQAPCVKRLPMTPGQPDFVFTDEEDGVVALKNGSDILYVSLYWRARHGVNFTARVHYITPQYDRIAVVGQETEYEPSGMTYKRPDWTNFGFGNGGLRYPGDIQSAHTGEELPIAKIPDGIKFRPGNENVYAGKGSFYTLRYGNYLIGMNFTKDKPYELKITDEYKKASELVSGKKIQSDTVIPVGPLSTVVLYKRQNEKHAAQDDFSAISDRVQNWVDKGYYPGASCLIAKDDKIVYEKYFGNYTPDTVVFIASAGKWLAAAAIAALVDEGKLSWDDPVSKWLPEFKDAKGKATLRQLMSHTAGYPDYQPSSKHRDDYQTLSESVREIVPLEPNDLPGAKFQYGGLAMQVAGRMAELATGKDWETIFQDNIAKPLAMKNTHFTPVDLGGGHSPMLGGGARCTLHDYANFLSMIYNNGMFDGKRVLSEKAMAEMQADQVRGAKITKPEFVETARGNTHHGIYGLGQWREALDDKGNAVLISSPGWAGAYPWIDKTCNIYGIILTHVIPEVANPDHFSSFYSSPILAMMARNAVGTDLKVKRGTVDIGDAQLYYETAGQGQPLILIHGHSLDHRMWDAQFMEFAKKYQVIRYDLRGYGLSDIPKDDRNFMHVEDLRKLMDKLQIQKAHLVGLSLGGFIVIDAMATYPERILSGVAASGTLFGLPGPDHPMDAQEKQERYTEIEQLRQKGVDVFKREWIDGLVKSGGSHKESIRPALTEMINQWSAWQPLHLEPRLLLGTSALDKLKAKAPINVPLLIILNPGDGQGNVNNADLLLPLFSKGKKIMLTDTGHMCNMETPELFNQTVTQYLDSLHENK